MNSPALTAWRSGASPSPSMRGWETPSRKPKCSRSTSGLVSSVPMTTSPPRVRPVVWASKRGAHPGLVGSVEEQQNVDLFTVRAAPGPVLGGALVDVAEDAPAVFGGHAARELARKHAEGLGRQTELAEAGGGQRDVHGALPGTVATVVDLVCNPRQPSPRAGGLCDPGEHVARGTQGAVAPDDEPLDVGAVDRRRTHALPFYSRLSQASVSAGARVPGSPERIRALFSMLTALSWS